MSKRIMTRHPEKGKSGVNISAEKYEQIRDAVVQSLGKHGEELTFQELTDAVQRRLAGRFDGSVTWYVTTVKLDLEARNVVERVPGSKPQRLRLAAK